MTVQPMSVMGDAGSGFTLLLAVCWDTRVLRMWD